MNYLIENDVPWHHRNHHEFPLNAMVVGDSFCIPKRDYKTATAMMQKLRTEYERYRSTTPGVRFKHKQVPGGIRVWRVM